MDENYCKEKTKVKATFTALSNPKIFVLRLSTINITRLGNNSYKCQMTKEPPSFYIECSFSCNVKTESVLSLMIKNYPQESERSSHVLVNNYFKINLEAYIFCGEGSAWRECKL